MVALNFLRWLRFNAVSERQLKYWVLATFAVLLIYFTLLNRHTSTIPALLRSGGPSGLPSPEPDSHPISKLVRGAQLDFKQLLGKRSLTLEQAASRYRERRGRHPPPGFDKWFEVAKEKEAVVVEDFFDRIYHDINPFWALDPNELRRMIHGQLQYIRVRDGKAWYVTDDIMHRQPWVQRWTELVQEMMPHLPDLDMILNVMDETRVVVPWEKINKYVAEEQSTRRLYHPDQARTNYTSYNEDDDSPGFDPGWIGGEAHKYWDHYRVACPPNSTARNIPSLPSFDKPVDPLYPREPASYALDGFVQNFTAASDPCLQPHLRGMHGTFIESVSMATIHELFPMFSGCKLPGNNELIIPGGMLLDDVEMFSGGSSHGGAWSGKKDQLVWRGTASGGRNKPDTWWHFHRHRFVQMMNGTTITSMEAGHSDAGPAFTLSSVDPYKVQARLDGKLGEWVDAFSDVGFTDLACTPGEPGRTCQYTSPYMALADNVPMKNQYDYKFLPDVDGNSYSARFRGFMRSTSLPLKATIYAEWHDDRLVPWVHFVPLDNTFKDIYSVMEYFLEGHDATAQRIAEEGRDWAEKVMRREDMMLYVWRLLLEYARVVDPERDRLAFVEDLR